MFEKIYKSLDIPGGSIMGLFTVSIITFCFAAVFFGKKIPSEVIGIYGMVLGAFAASKTIQKKYRGRENPAANNRPAKSKK